MTTLFYSVKIIVNSPFLATGAHLNIFKLDRQYVIFVICLAYIVLRGQRSQRFYLIIDAVIPESRELIITNEEALLRVSSNLL